QKRLEQEMMNSSNVFDDGSEGVWMKVDGGNSAGMRSPRPGSVYAGSIHGNDTVGLGMTNSTIMRPSSVHEPTPTPNSPNAQLMMWERVQNLRSAGYYDSVYSNPSTSPGPPRPSSLYGPQTEGGYQHPQQHYPFQQQPLWPPSHQLLTNRPPHYNIPTSPSLATSSPSSASQQIPKPPSTPPPATSHLSHLPPVPVPLSPHQSHLQRSRTRSYSNPELIFNPMYRVSTTINQPATLRQPIQSHPSSASVSSISSSQRNSLPPPPPATPPPPFLPPVVVKPPPTEVYSDVGSVVGSNSGGVGSGGGNAMISWSPSPIFTANALVASGSGVVGGGVEVTTNTTDDPTETVTTSNPAINDNNISGVGSSSSMGNMGYDSNGGGDETTSKDGESSSSLPKYSFSEGDDDVDDGRGEVSVNVRGDRKFGPLA
ncbi:hypothetical protein HDU76_002505, partial [Blyttiomyces sp. JEL0837]